MRSFIPVALPPPIAAPHYGGFWIRVAAELIDMLLLSAAGIPLRALFGSVVTLLAMDSQMPMHEMLSLRRWVRIIGAVAVAWAYRAGMESSPYQATLGKMAMHLKVIDLEGSRLSLDRATVRFFAKGLSTLALGIGHLMVGFDARKQGLHDRIAGTLVLYRNDRAWPPDSRRAPSL